MTSFRMQSFKQMSGYKWSNTYLVEAASLADVASAATVLAETEQTILSGSTTITGVRCSTVLAGDDSYVVVPFNLAGTYGAGGEVLAPWNCVRVDLTIASGGRPSRKYWKGVLTEGAVSFDTIDGDLLTDVAAAFTGLVGALSAIDVQWVDPDGQAIGPAIAMPKLQMRQMHRKRRKAVVGP